MKPRRVNGIVSAGILLAALFGGLLVGCEQRPADTSAAAAAKDLRSFMVDVVQPATQVLWDYGYANQITDENWAQVSNAAATLVNAVPTISAGGFSVSEKVRAVPSEWQDWSKRTSDMAAAAKRAADTKNQMELATAGDALVEICSGCHMAFDPNAKEPDAPPPP